MIDNDFDALIASKLQSAQMKIYLEIARVCKELGIEYALSFGTCIGAIRHHGFIPWDDDIDLCMRVEDLEKLESHKDLFKEDFFIQNRFTDPGYRLMITRIRDSNTTLIENSEINNDINHGIFVDIYPIYNCPKSGIKARKCIFDSMICRLMRYGEPAKNRGKLMTIGSTIILKLIPKRLRFVLSEYFYGKIRNQKYTGYVSYFYGNHSSIIYPEDCFFPVQFVKFEEIDVPVQADYDKYLRLSYRGDYMVLPPIERRKFHHDYAFIDFDHPYTDFKGIYYCKELKK